MFRFISIRLQTKLTTVETLVVRSKHIEDDAHVRVGMFVEPRCYRAHRDRRGFICGKAEYTGAYAAKRNSVQSVFLSGVETAAVARCELSAVLVSRATSRYGSNSVNDIR